MAELVGTLFKDECRRVGSRDRFACEPDDAERQHQNGAGAEIAVCIALGAWWEATNGTFGQRSDAADVRCGTQRIQVRSTPYPNGFLPLHDTDPDEDVFVLVTGTLPTYTIRGAIRGRDAKTPEHWTTTHPTTGRRLPHPCYAVTQRELAEPDRFVSPW